MSYSNLRTGISSVLLFVIFFFKPIDGISQTGVKNTFAQRKALYEKAKEDFQQFEKRHGGFVQTNNVTMHYLTWGNPRAIPLIWVHGSLTNSYEFLGIADSLVNVGYYVIAIDYYGHGQTPIPPHPVSLYHIADDIKQLMDHLRIKKAVFGGWSRGGAVCTAFYDSYPERVSGIILEDGGSVAVNTFYHKLDYDELKKRVHHLVNSFPADTVYDSEFDAYSAIYDPAWEGSQFENLAWIMKTTNKKYAICPGTLELFNMRTEKQWLDNVLRPTISPLFAESFSILEPKIIYRNLDVPLLILDPVGPDDMMPIEKENEALKALHPQLIEHKIYYNTGHNIHHEKRDLFIKDVKAFLKKVQP